MTMGKQGTCLYALRCGTMLIFLWLTGMPSAWSQRDSAASEAEVAGAQHSLLRGNPHRDQDLWHLASMDSVLVGAENLRAFLTRWRDLLDGETTPTEDTAHYPIEVIHFGGSHVQAGRIGWAFRNRLKQDRPGLIVGRGVQAPFRLGGSNGPPERGWASTGEWKLNTCAHRRHTGEWGVTGVEARCDSPQPIQCWSGAPAGSLCSGRFRLFAPPDDLAHWQLAANDSLWGPPHLQSAGCAEWVLPDHFGAPDTLTLVPDSGHAVIQGVEWRLEHPDVVFHDMGANGANTTSWMRNPHFPAQLRDMETDLVVLGWGINDAHMQPSRFNPERFKKHYTALIDSIRSALPAVEILLITNNDSHYRHRHNPNAEAVRDVMLELTVTQGVACWDLYGHLGGKASIDRLGATDFAASDRLHMRRDGYILLGELLYEVLSRAAFKLPHSG